MRRHDSVSPGLLLLTGRWAVGEGEMGSGARGVQRPAGHAPRASRRRECGGAHRSRTRGGQPWETAQARGWKAAVMRGPGAGAPQPRGVPATPPEWTVSRLNAQGRRPVLRRESDVQEQLLILGGLSWASGPPERWAAAGQGALL